MAESFDPSTGAEALAEVAKPKGRFNWALVGADPEALPWLGAGIGSIDEMRPCIEAQGDNVTFALLRIKLGTGALSRPKWVFLHASNVDGSPEKKELAGGRRGTVAAMRAIALVAPMKSKMEEFVKITLTIEVTCIEEFTVEEVIERLNKACVVDESADSVTVEKYQEALKEEVAEIEQIHEEEAEVAVAKEEAAPEAPPPAAAEVVLEPEPAAPPPEPVRKRPSVSAELPLPAPLPVAKAIAIPNTIGGPLLKQANNWMGEWQLRHFEVSHGQIRYWWTMDDAKAGRDCRAAFWLTDMHMERLGRTKFKIHLGLRDERPYALSSDISGQGLMPAVIQRTAHSTEEWMNAFWQHAAYAKAVNGGRK